MPSPDLMLAFLAAAAVFAFMPGPALLYTAAQTIARGRRAGFLAALGIHTGCYVHVIAAALGLSALFKAVPFLYAMVKIAGALYLIWLGIRMFRSQGLDAPADGAGSVSLKPAKSGWAAFRESFLVELLNPKVALFFLAFLPQFTDPGAGLPIWGQLLVLGIIVNCMFSSADILTILLADRVMRAMKGSKAAGQALSRIGGSVLMMLGLNMAFSRQ